MGGSGRSAVGGFAVAFLVVVTVTSAGAMPQAQTAGDSPTVVVTPDQDVADGQPVLVEMSGFPAVAGAVVQCSASVVDAPPTTSFPSSFCGTLAIPTNLPPSQETVPVSPVFTTGLFGSDGETVDCRQAPGCVVGFWSSSGEAAYAPISFGTGIYYSDDIRTTQQRNLEDGSTIQVVGEDVSPGEWSIAQCGRGYVDSPTPAQAAALCAPSTPVSPDADDAFIADLVVQDPLASSSGAEVPCGYDGCVVVLAHGGEPPVSDVAISFGPPVLTVTPSDDLVDRETVQIEVTGAPDPFKGVALCLLPLGPTRSTSQCRDFQGMALDRWGAGVDTRQADVRYDFPDDCRPDNCVYALFGGEAVGGDDPVAADPVPITFAPATVSFDPTSGLLGGQEISVTGQNMSYGGYSLYYCKEDVCGQSSLQPFSRNGVFTEPVPARQRFTTYDGQHVYCRADECHLQLTKLGIGIVASSPYELVTGQVETAPDTGLADGQTVEISGTDLMPSYDGPNLWIFPTGGWTLTQCDAAVLDDLSVIGTFTHCSVAPTSREVTVEGSTLDTSLDVESDIDKILGGATDCVASPGACVAGLVRLEQDGSVSAHLTPLAFHTSTKVVEPYVAEPRLPGLS